MRRRRERGIDRGVVAGPPFEAQIAGRFVGDNRARPAARAATGSVTEGSGA